MISHEAGEEGESERGRGGAKKTGRRVLGGQGFWERESDPLQAGAPLAEGWCPAARVATNGMAVERLVRMQPVKVSVELFSKP